MWKDSETEIDFLDYKYMVNILKDIVCNDDLLPASIGLYGDWGSGKSSLMHMCINELQEEKNAKCLIFNGWLFESYSDAKTALLNCILDTVAKEKKLTDKAKDILATLYKSVDKFKIAQKMIKYGAEFALTGGIGTLASMSGDAVLSIIKSKSPELIDKLDTDTSSIQQAIKDELDEKKLREDIREFQDHFAELLKETKIKRLVIFIDELDRCREDTILDTLEAMKLFMFTGKIAFVIGADERHISYAVKSKFKDIEGIQIDIGKEYLEKLVQYPIHIPRMDIDETEVYIASLLLSAEVSKDTFNLFQAEVKKNKEKDFLVNPLRSISLTESLDPSESARYKECLSIAKQLSPVLSSGLHGNPRQIKRFLNTLDMRMKMAEYKHVTLDRKVLAKIMMLEYIRSAAFNAFAELAKNEEISKELSLLENEETGDVSEELKLKNWKKDEWLSSWLSIEPFLADKELNQYFYFTRTSLDEKISRKSVILSPGAQDVLEKLMSKADIKINEALEVEVSEAEATTIMEIMSAKMSTETKIDKAYIKAFVAFSTNDSSRYVSGLEFIKSFSATSIPVAGAVYLAEFAKKSELVSEMNEVAKVWEEKNKGLATAYKNSMKG